MYFKCFIFFILLFKYMSYEIKYTGEDIHLIPNKYDSLLIWMHGLGDKPHSYINLFNNDNYNICPPDMKIILLGAPKAHVTVNGNLIQRSWFDIINFDDGFNFQDVKRNSLRIFKIIEEEAKNIEYNRILIGGFSQGACMSYYIGYTFQHKLGGIIACSGFLFPQIVINENNKDINVFVGHGTEDRVLKFNYMQKYLERTDTCENYEKHYYENEGHTINEEEINDLKLFIKKVLKK